LGPEPEQSGGQGEEERRSQFTDHTAELEAIAAATAAEAEEASELDAIAATYARLERTGSGAAGAADEESRFDEHGNRIMADGTVIPADQLSKPGDATRNMDALRRLESQSVNAADLLAQLAAAGKGISSERGDATARPSEMIHADVDAAFRPHFGAYLRRLGAAADAGAGLSLREEATRILLSQLLPGKGKADRNLLRNSFTAGRGSDEAAAAAGADFDWAVRFIQHPAREDWDEMYGHFRQRREATNPPA
jgi:hypothetical protein